ncbi:toll/interleukin-1 receptor domain-containing protein [uncultured Cohaesibacter sp.]|uniref:toll/interleukin-1 receptor domain-containing protein n=1 Tax=uncultured Cohaesibacter sp. TaxID=1002546 RepID=UPI0029C84401|nr:toll/interleukin-1 receptor domain-containing protein [uncultured Cohaesibacter sp.]
MVEFVTRSELLGFARNMGLTESASLQKRAQERSPQGSTFLSHSSKDKELVAGAISVLEDEGASVYIDKKDTDLPPYTNRETAATLKKRINQSRKFVLLASSNSQQSKWVPWELGLADGYKGMDRTAIFPAVDSQGQSGWVNWEYIGLYDRIVWGQIKGDSENRWLVHNHIKNTAIRLSEWLRQ